MSLKTTLNNLASASTLPLIAIMVGSVALRMAAALYLGNSIESLPGINDQQSYHMLAQRVMDGFGFTVALDWWPLTHAGKPTAHWSYLYTLYLIAVYSAFDVVPLIARVIQVVIVGLAWPLLAYRIARHLIGQCNDPISSISKWGPLIAAAWSAAYPYFVYYSAALLTESFYIVLVLWSLNLTLGIAASLKASLAPTGLTKQWLLLGLAIGGAMLLRQLFLFIVPFLFVWMAWAARPQIARSVRVLPMRQHWLALLRGAVIVSIILAACIAPWTFLNYQNFGKFVLLNTNAGFAFFWANHPIYGTQFVELLPQDTYFSLVPAELVMQDEATLSSALFQLGLQHVLADPVRYALLSLSRIATYFVFWPSPNSGLISNITRVTSFGLALPFMAYGLVLSLRQWRTWSLLYLFIAVYTGIHLLSWALVRYRLPVDAALLMFAAYGLAHLVQRFKLRTSKHIPKHVEEHIEWTNHLKSSR